MAKIDKYLMTVRVVLDDGFVDSLRDVMADELKSASRKWMVRMSSQDSDAVYAHALAQLRRRVTDMAHTQWDMSDMVVLKLEYPNSVTLTVPGQSKFHDLSLLRMKDGWTLYDEPNDDSVVLKDIKDRLQDEMKTWLRTAVFYGVGSYSE